MAGKKASTALWFSSISVLHFIAMAFLIIACVTAPVFKQIGLSKYGDYTFGVFGYCDSSSDTCSKASASYDPQQYQDANGGWKMSDHARIALGKILIITPIAAGLNFFSFVVSLIPLGCTITNSDSYKVSGIVFIFQLFFSVVGFLSAALMCIVILLLFYPNVTWCSWLLIPAAVVALIANPLVFFAHANTGTASNGNVEDDYDSIADDLIVIKNQTENKKKDDFQPIQYYNDNLNTVLPDFNSSHGSAGENLTLPTISEASSSYLDEKYPANEEPVEQETFSAIQNDGNGRNQSPTHQAEPYAIDDTRMESLGDLKKQPSKEELSDSFIRDTPDSVLDYGSSYYENDSSSNFQSISQRGVNPYYNSHQEEQQHRYQQYPQQLPMQTNMRDNIEQNNGYNSRNYQNDLAQNRQRLNQRELMGQQIQQPYYPQHNHQGQQSQVFNAKNYSRQNNFNQQQLHFPQQTQYQNRFQNQQYSQIQSHVPQMNYSQNVPANVYLNQPQAASQQAYIPPVDQGFTSSNRFKPAYKKKIQNNTMAPSSLNDQLGFR